MGAMDICTSSTAILATGGYDHTVKLWQAHTGICYWTGQHAESQVNSLAITPDKKRLAAAGYQHIRLYDIQGENVNTVINYEGVTKNVTSVGFQEDSKWMYSTGEDCIARIWDLRYSNAHCSRIFQTNAPINYAILHPNQSELIMCDENGMLYIWNLRTDNSEKIFSENSASILCVAMNETGSQMACVNTLGSCIVWSMLNDQSTVCGQLISKQVLNAHGKQALKCKFSPDGSYLVTTSADQTARIWHTDDFSLLHELSVPGGQRWVWDACFTDDSEYLITVSSDSIGRLWQIHNGTIEREYIGHQKSITALAFKDNRSC